MESDALYEQMKVARAEMGHAEAEMLKDPLDNGKFRRFVQAKQRFWELADRQLAKSEKRRTKLGDIFNFEP